MKKIAVKRGVALATCALMLGAFAAGGMATLPSYAAVTRSTYTADLEKPLQTFNGWGLSLSWWATEIGNWTRIGSSGKEKREEVAEALYGKSGLNLNIARYNVGGGDDPTHIHMSDDRNTPGWKGATVHTDANGNTYFAPDNDYVFGDMNDPDTWIDWEDLPTGEDPRSDYRQLWVLDWIQKEHGADGQNDLMTEYYSNSPPYWMTISGCTSGGEGSGTNLIDDEEHNQAFVDYFLDVYEYIVSQGFEIDNLQPFNESGSYYWGTGGDQEGCYFSPQQKIHVLELLREEMAERGIEEEYNWGDETNPNVAWDQYSAAYGLQGHHGTPGSTIISEADRFTYHTYWYDVSSVQKLYRAAKQLGTEIEMSEICWSEADDNGEKKYDPNSLTTGFKYTQNIIDTVKHGGVDAFIFWQGMEDMVGQKKGGTNYGLIQGVYYDQATAEGMGTDLAAMGLNYQDFVLAKSFYMSGQYTKYIRPGYTIIDVDESNTLAAISPDGETLVVVKQNNNDNADSFTLNLNGFEAESVEKVWTDKTHSWAKTNVTTDGSALYDTASARSVSTYIIHGKSTKGTGYFVDESAFTSKSNLGALTSALQEGGENEQYYYVSTGGFGTSGGNARYYGDTLSADTSKSANAIVAFRFYGTGFAVSSPAKNDAADLDICIDPAEEYTGSNTATATAHINQTTQENGKIVYSNNTLEEGWHTVYLKAKTDAASHHWVNIDGVFIYTSADDTAAESASLKITDAAAAGGTLAFTYESTLSDYTLHAEYRLEGVKEWTKGEAELADGKGTVTGLANGKKYDVRILAEKEGATPLVSALASVVNLPQKAGVLYFVDCGTADPFTLADGAVLGTLQSSSDRSNGNDVLSGKSWGYTNAFTKAGHYSESDAMTSMWSYDQISSGELGYSFTIPTAGNYKVLVGFFAGPSWGSRTEHLKIGTTVDEDVTLTDSAYFFKSYDVTTSAADETVTLTLTKADTHAAQISLIAILEENAEKFPIYTSGASNYNSEGTSTGTAIVGTDVLAEAKSKAFTVYYSDGTEDDTIFAANAANTTVQAKLEGETVVSGERFTVSYSNPAVEGVHPMCTYTWQTRGGRQLYYNIDCAFTGTGKDDDRATTPPDDASELGIYQSSTHDREYGEDLPGHDWGYLGSHFDDGIYWVDNKENKWSIREGKDEGSSVSYKMTGFLPDEALDIKLAGHCSNWGNRTVEVFCNNVSVGEWELKSSQDGTITEAEFKGGSVKADSKGELVVKVAKKIGEGPQVGYIKVWNDVDTKPSSSSISANETTVDRDGKVTLKNLEVGSEVYVYDENGVLVDNFEAQAATFEYDTSVLPSTSFELHFVQAEAGDLEDATKGTMPSKEFVVGVLGLDILYDATTPVRGGDAVVVRFEPRTAHGVTALQLTTPENVTYDLTEGFYHRALTNGTYKVTLKADGRELEKEFVVDTIDTLDFGFSYDNTAWSKENAKVTFTPVLEKSTVASLKVGETELVNEDGTYTFTATENGPYTAVLTTTNGFEYEYGFEVTSIDKTVPTVEYGFDFSVSAGVTLDYEAVTASGGSLFMTVDGGEKQQVTDPSIVSLEKAGKYELWFENGVGASTSKTVFYVSHGAENANLATVTVGEDGTVSVAEKARAAASAKLYRAGETEEISSMKAEKAGKYYLELTSGEEKEVVVFEIAAPVNSLVVEGQQEGNSSGLAVMIVGIVVGVLAIAAAAVVCPILVKKGRKNG